MYFNLWDDKEINIANASRVTIKRDVIFCVAKFRTNWITLYRIHVEVIQWTIAVKDIHHNNCDIFVTKWHYDVIFVSHTIKFIDNENSFWCKRSCICVNLTRLFCVAVYPQKFALKGKTWQLWRTGVSWNHTPCTCMAHNNTVFCDWLIDKRNVFTQMCN